MSEEVVLPLKGFVGLNVREPVGSVQDNELTKCINFDLGRAGELTKRTGFDQLHAGTTLGTNQVKVIGHLITPTVSRIIAKAGNSIYWSNDGVSWTLIGVYDVEWGVQYADKFYMVRRTSPGVLEWAGTGDAPAVPVAVTGSPTGTFCIVHKERLFVLHTEGSGAGANCRVWFSKPGTMNQSTDWVSTNTLDVKAGDGDFLVCAASVNDVLVLFKAWSSWGLYVQGTDATQWILRNLNPQIGCVSKYTPREIEGNIYFVSSRGVYKTDGNSFIDISEQIASVLKGRVVNVTNVNQDSAAWWEDKYIVLLQPSPSINVYYVYHLRAEGWTKWEISGNIIPFIFMEVRTATPQHGLYCGDKQPTGRVFRFGSGVYADMGLPYDATLETKDYDFDMLANYKRGKWIALDTLGEQTLQLTHIIDGVERDVRLINSVTERKAHKTHGPGYFRVWRYRIAAVGGNSFTLYGFVLFMHPKRTIIKASA